MSGKFIVVESNGTKYRLSKHAVGSVVVWMGDHDKPVAEVGVGTAKDTVKRGLVITKEPVPMDVLVRAIQLFNCTNQVTFATAGYRCTAGVVNDSCC